MATGPLIAGVIGNKKFVYDVWGNVVNLASRLEQLSKPNSILISERMSILLEEQYILEEQEPIEIRGLGMRKTFFHCEKEHRIMQSYPAKFSINTTNLRTSSTLMAL